MALRPAPVPQAAGWEGKEIQAQWEQRSTVTAEVHVQRLIHAEGDFVSFYTMKLFDTYLDIQEKRKRERERYKKRKRERRYRDANWRPAGKRKKENGKWVDGTMGSNGQGATSGLVSQAFSHSVRLSSLLFSRFSFL